MSSKSITPGESFPSEEAAYLYYRAEEQLELAQAATHPAAVRAHYILAGHYLDGAYGEPAEEN